VVIFFTCAIIPLFALLTFGPRCWARSDWAAAMRQTSAPP